MANGSRPWSRAEKVFPPNGRTDLVSPLGPYPAVPCIGSSRQALEPRQLDLNRLVGCMSDLLRRTLGESVSIETILAGGLWKTSVDPNQLENALLNLAINRETPWPQAASSQLRPGTPILTMTTQQCTRRSRRVNKS